MSGAYERFKASQQAEEMRMFHWRDNLYFGRLPDGFVRVVKFSRPPHVMLWHNERACTVPTEYPRADGEFYSVEVILDLRIPPQEWASIVASVSKLGESGGRQYKVLEFHNDDTLPNDIENKQ